jgi:hypothetical protein
LRSIRGAVTVGGKAPAITAEKADEKSATGEEKA